MTVSTILGLSIEIPQIAVTSSVGFNDSWCCPHPTHRIIPRRGAVGPGDLIVGVFGHSSNVTYLEESLTWNGWGGLRKVIYIVENDLPMFYTSAVSASIALRPIGSDACAVAMKNELECAAPEMLEYDGAEFNARDRKKWQDEPFLKFTCVTRAPACPGEVVSDYMYLYFTHTRAGRENLGIVIGNDVFIRGTAECSGCAIRVSHKYLTGGSLGNLPRGPLQLAFSGTSSSIRKAKTMLEMEG